MLEKYTYKNENGEIIFDRLKLYKTIHRTWRDYDFDNELPTLMLYNLPNVIKGLQENKTIYFVSDEERVEALRKARHIATCFSNFCNDKDVLYDVLKIFKGATVYIVDDTFKTYKSQEEETKQKMIGNQTFINILLELAQEVRLLEFQNPKNDIMFSVYGDLISFFEDYYITDIRKAKYSWRKLIKNGKILNNSNCIENINLKSINT